MRQKFLEAKKAQKYYPGKHFSSCLSEINSDVSHLEHRNICRHMQIYLKSLLMIEKEQDFISEKKKIFV